MLDKQANLEQKQSVIKKKIEDSLDAQELVAIYEEAQGDGFKGLAAQAIWEAFSIAETFEEIMAVLDHRHNWRRLYFGRVTASVMQGDLLRRLEEIEKTPDQQTQARYQVLLDDAPTIILDRHAILGK